MARQGTVTTALGHRLGAVFVTAIGATASIGDPEPDGTFVVTVRPWWSAMPVKRDGPRISREPLAEIRVRVPHEIPGERRKAYVDAYVQDHGVWTKLVASEEVERRWRGIEWD